MEHFEDRVDIFLVHGPNKRDLGWQWVQWSEVDIRGAVPKDEGLVAYGYAILLDSCW